MAKSVLPTNPTAAQVRAALGLPAQRGKLSQAVVDQYNKGKRANKRYVPGQGRRNKADAVATREALRAQGVAVGARGPLPKAALAQTKG